MPIGEALAKDATLLFMSLNNAGRAGVAAIAAEIGEMAAAGKVRPVIGETLPLAEARRPTSCSRAAPGQDRAGALSGGRGRGRPAPGTQYPLPLPRMASSRSLRSSAAAAGSP